MIALIAKALGGAVNAVKAAVSPCVALTDEQRAQRAEQLAGIWSPTIWYFIDPEKGTRNGGRDPRARDCATHWVDGGGKSWATADCVGFVSWTQGFPRRLKSFPLYSGAINTDSMLLDAAGTARHFKAIAMPHRGCVVTMPGVFDAKGKRLRPGHTGTVVYVDPRFNPAQPDMRLVKVAHCSPRHHKPYGQAIAITDGLIFATRPGWKFLSFTA